MVTVLGPEDNPFAPPRPDLSAHEDEDEKKGTGMGALTGQRRRRQQQHRKGPLPNFATAKIRGVIGGGGGGALGSGVG